MKPAIIYSRVSTDQQDNKSAVIELKNVAKAMGFKVLMVFEEQVSGLTRAEEREEFSKLLDFIEKNKVHTLFLWELSRLGRNISNIHNIIAKLTEKKVSIYIKKDGLSTLDENGNENSFGSVMISVLAAMADIEIKQMKERSKRGLREHARNGGRTGNIPPYGYKMKDGIMIPDEAEAEVVKLIYDKYLDGLGVQSLASYLNNEGIPTKYNKIFDNREITIKSGLTKQADSFKWKDGTVYGILTNSLYYGKRKYKDEIFDCPAIIDEETFIRTNEMLKSKFNKQSINRLYTNIFKKKIKCGICGKGYFMHKRADKKDNAYKCLSVREKEQCGNGGISIDKLNNAVYALISSYVKMHYVYNDSHLDKHINEKENLIIELKNSETNISNENKKLNALLDMHLEGRIDAERYTKKHTEINKNLERFRKNYRVQKNRINEVNALIRKLKSLNLVDIVEDINIFKKYVIEIIDKIIILQLKNLGELENVFTTKGDVAFYVDLRTLNTGHFFIISRRSDLLLMEMVGKNIDIKEREFIGDLKHFAKLSIPTVVSVD